MLMLLLLLLQLQLCLQAAGQDQAPGRCDVKSRMALYTSCTSCAAAAAAATAPCPPDFTKTGTTNCSYVVQIGSRELELQGCRQVCVKSYLRPWCCSGYWGPLCFHCPSWSGKMCNFKGKCEDEADGNGTCICADGFTGFACQECKNPLAYGSLCDKECDCVHGVCNNGPEGDGKCLCQPPYTGKRCDQVSSSCRNCGSYSYCRVSTFGTTCECLPGYRKMFTEKCQVFCSQRDCDVNAQCSLQGGKIKCVCQPDYEGDGKFCVPRNPCMQDNGGCPANSTVCVFKGPNKAACECMSGMSPVGGGPESGCQLMPACQPDTCDPSAVCETQADGRPRCVCEVGQIGDGRRCYGNLMERLVELDTSGGQRENLTGAIDLFEKGCSQLLSRSGPFTAFFPILKAPLTGVNEELVCKNHLILGQHLHADLEDGDFTLFGGGKLRAKPGKRFVLMDNPTNLYTIIQPDLPASNGVIHIIDKPITNTPGGLLRDDKFADKTIGEILTLDEKYNRFLSLVDNCGAPPPLRGPGPFTVFVPTNNAVDRARDGSILYMLHDAKHKLQELLRHHIFSQAVLTLDELSALPYIRTMANQPIAITASEDGALRLGPKAVPLATANIMASNGVIHMIDGLLYPPSILPILPHRCDVTESKITVTPCAHCSYLDEVRCPDGSVEMERHQSGCDYLSLPFGQSYSKGCAKFCNSTRQVPECCPGFFGPDCKPCIGGFQHPCYDRGTCFHGIHGNGSCSCHSNFTGFACHICSDPSKHGANCDEECLCLHGVCDNRPGSGGACRFASCLDGFSGKFCDKKASACNSDGLMQHCHVHAYCTQTGLETRCVCRDGYDGDGHSCLPINLCLKRDRGGCDANAECSYLGPGNSTCLCSEGWTGDGKVCVEINNCQLGSRGGCSINADCNHIGPGQSDCVCKSGYMGDGKICDLINPCRKNNGGCSILATCELRNGSLHTCTCPDGYAGDGNTCYGPLMDELDLKPELYSFYRMIQKFSHSSEDLSGNLTVLVPSREVLKNMSEAEKQFWTSRHHLPHFLRAHYLLGIYSVEDLDRLVGTRLPTMNPAVQWEVRNLSGLIHVGNASIVAHNLPATNGYIHIINQVLAPSSSDLPPEPPTLMEFLNSSSNFTLFRKHALMYNLSESVSEFTVLLPTDRAVREELERSNRSLLDLNIFRYHVLPNVLLFPDHLTDGLLISSLVDDDYQVQFHLDPQNRTLVNDVPLGGGFTETQFGVLMVVQRVLKVRRNRCSKQVTLQVNGRCSDCDGPPRCLFSYKPVRPRFPSNMRPNCNYRKRVGAKRKSVQGCFIKCLRFTTDHSCCPGYYGHECFKCPGDVGSWCSNHGECQDGNHGNGECRCYEGFHGTNCEDCEPGRYGVNCSSKCVCDHGRCEDGLAGGGRCVCYKGWKGSSCSVEIKDDACGGVCDENANCITGPSGSAPACVCAAGYQGNGTSCRELDLCSMSNGGCSEFAGCTKVSAGERTCSCNDGYTGDGVVCLELDGCLVNNGGCHAEADCIRTGPNMTACKCRLGFQGTGHYCYAVNPCRTNNGECSKYARCEYLGQGKRSCTCLRGHVGDGLECRGTTNDEVFRQPENGFFRRMLTASGPFRLYGEGPYTLFIPLEETNNESTVETWKTAGRLEDLARNHIVSCELLTLSDLKTSERAVTVSGYTLRFSVQEGSVWVNNRSRVVRSDYTTTTGVIHHVDVLLPPYRLEDKPTLEPRTMNFSEAAGLYGYTRFFKLIQDAGVLPLLQDPAHQPFTVFWPTDAALAALPAERQRWLSSPDHRDQLAATVKAHIVRNSRITRIGQQKRPTSYRTMHGSTIKFSCDKKLPGAILINGDAARLGERYLTFREGLAFGIDQLLEPPGLGAFCDSLDNPTTYGRCGSCLIPPPCSLRHVDTGKTERCYQPPSRFTGRRWYGDLDHSFNRWGCKRVCTFPSWVQKCCKNHYGRDCQVCPGGVEDPCGRHGDCDDGVRGSGSCKCHRGFQGTSCDSCAGGYYGDNCTSCSCTFTGHCDDGMDGSGHCTCNSGWTGDRCQDKIGSVPERCRWCHPQADCTDLGCQCKPGYQGNGTFCSAEPLPDLCSDYNGGCHLNAACNQTGLTVNCTCLAGYHGDGVSCQPIDRCVEEENGGCSEFASCRFSGPNQRECQCLPGFVGNGVQCLEKLLPPVDQCLQENGGCDPVASCRDLHYHANTAGVFHLSSPEGKYRLNFTEADRACRADGAELATFKQLGDAQQLGVHLCVAGWMAGGQVGYPTRFPSLRCGDNHVGLVTYKEPVERSSRYDAWCYRLRDVSCSCPDGFVGDGDFCNSVLTSVLARNSNFSIFYKLLLDYSLSSPEGRTLVDVLSHRKSEVTLFVPHNAGFSRNQTLSGRDLEYHVSANHSWPFRELRPQTLISSRLGFNLTVSHGNNQTLTMVDRRLLLDWDIPAVNGIIHVIEAPLAAPPPPVSTGASRSPAHSSGAVATIVALLLAGLLAVLGYYVFKHKRDAFRFHMFRNEDEDGGSSRTKHTLVSIPNPLYSSSRTGTGTQNLGETSPEVEPPEPEEAPDLLGLDQ
ncbi:stabilin-1 [Cololabis saira]|uniref:stabilin-1 n=1 Tax=Cololabis saira TaxID=129043 RepID=UPI002AD25337|nr:stabilin-1 [Cololabis saira]